MTHFRSTAHSRVEPMPSSIVQAVCKVMASLDAVKKSAFNQQGSYKYASADDIYAAVVLRMAEAGLMVTALEAKEPAIIDAVNKKGEPTRWAKITFQFVLATTDASWTDATCTRTVMLQILGPQTFMAAQSYCEKAFLRSLFKLPTGEMELDEIYTMQDDERRHTTSASAKRNGVWDEVQQKIENAQSLSDLAQIDTEYRGKIPKQWRDPFSDLLSRRNEQILVRAE